MKGMRMKMMKRMKTIVKKMKTMMEVEDTARIR